MGRRANGDDRQRQERKSRRTWQDVFQADLKTLYELRRIDVHLSKNTRMWRIISCLFQNGLAYMNHLQVKGLVIADSDTLFKIDKPKARPQIGLVSDGLPQGVFQCLCAVCLRFNTGVDTRKSSKYSEYDLISVERTKELTAHQYLLCSESVWVYVMKDRSWCK